MVKYGHLPWRHGWSGWCLLDNWWLIDGVTWWKAAVFLRPKRLCLVNVVKRIRPWRAGSGCRSWTLALLNDFELEPVSAHCCSAWDEYGVWLTFGVFCRLPGTQRTCPRSRSAKSPWWPANGKQAIIFPRFSGNPQRDSEKGQQVLVRVMVVLLMKHWLFDGHLTFRNISG